MASIRSGIGENMEDRYLFKAKHFEEWHTGNIVKEPDGLYIRDIKENVMAYIDDESTICQCTGLKDKNGKPIWENDIVRGKMHGNYGYRKLVGVVQYYIDAFKVNVKPNSFWGDYKNIPNACEVIGNIFDNKELLESEG